MSRTTQASREGLRVLRRAAWEWRHQGPSARQPGRTSYGPARPTSNGTHLQIPTRRASPRITGRVSAHAPWTEAMSGHNRVSTTARSSEIRSSCQTNSDALRKKKETDKHV